MHPWQIFVLLTQAKYEILKRHEGEMEVDGKMTERLKEKQGTRKGGKGEMTQERTRKKPEKEKIE